MTWFSAVTLVLRASCGACSTCISCEMSWDVLRPLMRPSTLLVLTGSTFPTWGRRARGGRPRSAAPVHDRSGGPDLSNLQPSATQELHDRLPRLVGLRQHRGTCLGPDLRAGEGHHFLGHVGVTDARLRRGQALYRHVQVVDPVLEPVLVGTERRPGRRDV